MNKAKALLDSLMGPSRDLAASEKKGDDFKAENVCKMYLVGLCPDQLLSKRVETIKPCTRIHSQPLKDEFIGHPDKAKYERDYERELLHYMLDICREVDDVVASEKKKCRRRETVVKVPEHLQPKMEEHEQERKVKIAMAERLGNEGDVDAATKAMADAEACQKLIEGMKKLHTREWPGEDMCTVCGTKYLCGKFEDIKGYERPRELDVWENDHMEDKLHLAYKKVRDKVQELKDKKAAYIEERKGGGDRDRDRRRSRSRDRRGGDRDRDRRGDRREEKGGGATGDDVRPGDWTCPKCNENVFAWKDSCFKCGEKKPKGSEGSVMAKSGRGGGDDRRKDDRDRRGRSRSRRRR